MARSTVHNGLDPLHIGLPGSVGTSVGVGNLNTKGNALATIITLRHSLHLLSEMMAQKLRPNRRLDMIAEFSKKSKCFFEKNLFFENNIDILPWGRYNEGNKTEKRGETACMISIVFR